MQCRHLAPACICVGLASPFWAYGQSSVRGKPGHALPMGAWIVRLHRVCAALTANMPNLPFSKTNTVAEQVNLSWRCALGHSRLSGGEIKWRRGNAATTLRGFRRLQSGCGALDGL